MDMKEAFESWWLAKVEKEIGFPLEKGMELNYGNSEIDLAWSAWSASRESLVVKLPDPVDYPDGCGDVYEAIDPDQLIEAIHETGIRTK